MSIEPLSPKNDDASLRRWISAWCDGVISEAEHAQLAACLKECDEARRTFVGMLHIHSRMQGQTIAQEYLATLMPSALDMVGPTCFEAIETTAVGPPTFLQMVRDRSARIHHRPWAWAAVLLIGVLGWQALYWSHGSSANLSAGASPVAKVHSVAPGAESSTPQVMLARVTDYTGDCQWYLDRGSQTKVSPSAGIAGGETIRVTSGRIKLTFNSGTVVTLHAPALFQVISEMQTRLLLGKVTARIAKGAEGFSVVTPRATVIDLGTEFGIEVNEVGATDLVVFQGEVNFDYVTQQQGGTKRQLLHTGQGMHLDALGTASRIVSITDQRYSDSPAAKGTLRPPLISAVRDNIPRDAWNYYEIVQSGMREDAKAFADREEHEWNGVTTEGMPEYLLGGDYVKTFNNDKVKNDIEITVKLERAAKLYILFDKRIPPPSWLMKDFTNTGDEIGVDEGVYCVDGVWYTNHHPGVGPGVSIDHVSTIWERDVKGACWVKLGPTESTTVDINMYGIVAVPMDDSAEQVAINKNSKDQRRKSAREEPSETVAK